MAGTIATLLAASKTIASADGQKGPARHASDEIRALQTISDPVLAAPYVQADTISTILAHAATCVSGNFTITINLPKYGTYTTGNIIFNAAEATIQTAIDSALAGETFAALYSPGDVDVALSQNLNDTVNSAVLTFNGTSVNAVYAEVTTQDVDLGDDQLNAVMLTANGTEARPVEAFFKYFNVIEPVGNVTPQGATVALGDYQTMVSGDMNPSSLSPGLLDALVNDLAFEDDGLSTEFRRLIGCV